jgi:hypothetical protein
MRGEQSLSPVNADLPPELERPFAEFWEAYPRRGAYSNPKRAARVSYLRAVVRDHIDPETLTAQAKAYNVWCSVMCWTGTCFVAMAVTWLNQGRWEAEYTVGYDMVRHLPDGPERDLIIERINKYMEDHAG